MKVRCTKYSSDVPEQLRNRPHKLVKYCLKKISLTNSADLSAISIVKKGVFLVKTFENNESKRYMVSFADDVNMKNVLLWIENHLFTPVNICLSSFSGFVHGNGMLYHRSTLIHLF